MQDLVRLRAQRAPPGSPDSCRGGLVETLVGRALGGCPTGGGGHGPWPHLPAQPQAGPGDGPPLDHVLHLADAEQPSRMHSHATAALSRDRRGWGLVRMVLMEKGVKKKKSTFWVTDRHIICTLDGKFVKKKLSRRSTPMKNRAGASYQCSVGKFNKLRFIFVNKQQSLKGRLKLFNAVVTPTALFGLSTLALTARQLEPRRRQ